MDLGGQLGVELCPGQCWEQIAFISSYPPHLGLEDLASEAPIIRLVNTLIELTRHQDGDRALPREPLSMVEKRLWWLGILEEAGDGWRWFAPTMRALVSEVT